MPVVAGSTNYECVTDEVTGLTWQVKGPKNLITYHPKAASDDPDVFTMGDSQNYKAANFRYPWQASALGTTGDGWYSGLNEATLDEGAEDEGDYANAACGYLRDNRNEGQPLYCSTGSYTDEVNRLGACGKTNWVVPTVEQLRSIVNYNDVIDYSTIAGTNDHALDKDFFDCNNTGNCVIEKNYINICFFVQGPDENVDPDLTCEESVTHKFNSEADPVYWTSNQVKGEEQLAWCVDLQTGSVNTCHKREDHRVLVVSSNVPTEFFSPVTTSDDSAK